MDRSNLGRQTYGEFANFQPPDDARKFLELYTVQRLTANAVNPVNPAAKVVVTTVQRLCMTPDEILANFRNSFFPRMAVTVDMISTGADVKPIACSRTSRRPSLRS